MAGQILYFGDPMCSWCYGFAPHISKIRDHFKKDLDFRLVMGGLRPGGTEKIGSMSSFLKHHWEEVNERSGQLFKYEIFDDPNFVYDTEPPCRAVVTIREMDPLKEFDFFKAVQSAFYQQNSDTNKTSTYTDIANTFDIDSSSFTRLFESEEIKTKTQKDFEFSQKLGVRGFPSTVLMYNEKYFLLANGYQEANSIIPIIDSILTTAD